MATTFSADFEKRTYRKVAWRLIPFLFLCYMLAYLDRVNVGFAKLQMQQDLAFSDTVYGVGAGIFFLGYFLFEVPSNVLLHRIGARIWIARIMILWGLIASAMMFTGSQAMFYSLRFLLGVAEAGFFPGIILYLTYWYPRTHRARMVASFMTATALAGVIGGPVSGGILAQLAGVAGLAGWQWLYLLEGLPSVLVGVTVLLVLADNPGKAKWLTGDERALLLQRLEEEERKKRSEGHAHHRFLDAFRVPQVWILCLVYFGIVMGTYGISFWLPQIIKETISQDPWQIGMISAIPWGVAAVVMVLVGQSSDRRNERRWHIALSAIVGAAAFALSAVPGSSGWTGMVLLTIATAGTMSAVASFWSLPTGILSGTAAAAGIAWINSVGNLAGYCSPFIVGRIRDATHSMTLALLMLSVSLGIAALLTIYVTGMRPRLPVPQPARA